MADERDKRERQKAEIIDFVARSAKLKSKSEPQPINVRGDGNVIGNNNTYIHTEKVVHEVRPQVTPGNEHITDEQAATIQYLVKEIVRLEAIAKSKPKSYQAVYSALNRRFKAPQYRLLKLVDYDAIEKYLRGWIGRLNASSSARKDPDWRKGRYASIKTKVRMWGWEDRLAGILWEEFGVTSIKSLSDGDLKRVSDRLTRWQNAID